MNGWDWNPRKFPHLIHDLMDNIKNLQIMFYFLKSTPLFNLLKIHLWNMAILVTY